MTVFTIIFFQTILSGTSKALQNLSTGETTKVVTSMKMVKKLGWGSHIFSVPVLYRPITLMIIKIKVALQIICL